MAKVDGGYPLVDEIETSFFSISLLYDTFWSQDVVNLCYSESIMPVIGRDDLTESQASSRVFHNFVSYGT